jgi:heat shock protein HtpX
MGKRIFLFIVTNIAVVLTLTVVLSLLGVGRYVGPHGLDIGSLAIFSFIWGMGGAFISLQMSRWMAKMATGMKIVDGRTGNPESDRVYQMIAGLTQKAGLPMPEVGIYDSPEVNAFATGPSRNRALVAVSTGLLRSMRDDEVEAVLGHEVTHISNGDMVTMTLLQGVINAFVIFFSRLIAYVIANRGDSRERGYNPG